MEENAVLDGFRDVPKMGGKGGGEESVYQLYVSMKRERVHIVNSSAVKKFTVSTFRFHSDDVFSAS